MRSIIAGLLLAAVSSSAVGEDKKATLRYLADQQDRLIAANEAIAYLKKRVSQLTEMVALVEAENQLLDASLDKLVREGLEKAADDSAVVASAKIGLSTGITCGDRIVTIPMIVDGKLMGNWTAWKASIVGVTYFNPKAVPESKRTKDNPILDTIQIMWRDRGDKTESMMTDKANYAPLLECLDKGPGIASLIGG